MYAWIVRWLMRRAIRRVNAGDIGPFLSTFADDATLVFPGQNSWAGEHRGKDELERFYRRFVRVGLQVEPQEIIVAGAPWNMTVCLRYTDQATGPGGDVVYTNCGMIYAKIAWGKIKSYEVYEDTEKVAEFDKYLASHEPAGTRTAVGSGEG